MSEIIYLHYFDLEHRIRVSAVKEKKGITGFTVQLEVLFEDNWHAVVRYDTAHQFVHRDQYHLNGKKEKIPLYFDNLNLAFTYAISDIRKNWERYSETYRKGG